MIKLTKTETGVNLKITPETFAETPRLIAYKFLDAYVKEAFEKGVDIKEKIFNFEEDVRKTIFGVEDPRKYVETLFKKYNKDEIVFTIEDLEKMDIEDFKELLPLYVLFVFEINFRKYNSEKEITEKTSKVLEGLIELSVKALTNILES